MPFPNSPALVCAAGLLLSASLSVAQSPSDMTRPDHQPSPPGQPTTVLDLSRLANMNQLLDQLMTRRVIFVGEQHDRYDDHLSQLAIIEGLVARGRSLVIGMEMFQQPYQAPLDAYIAGTISEAQILAQTQYFERWRYDYRLYRPILQFAREQRIPVIALNLEAELTGKVGDAGIAALTDSERARLPTEINRDDPAYRARIEVAFKHHPPELQGNFEHFLEAQLLWDEGMAERAARALTDYPGRTLVVLAGDGHLEYGQGIPQRLLRRQPVSSAIVLNGTKRAPDPSVADFLLYPQSVELPPAGLLGVLLKENTDAVQVKDFAESSGAKVAGILAGDRIVRVNETPIASYADLRIALLDQSPSQQIPVEVVRPRLLGADERLTFLVELH